MDFDALEMGAAYALYRHGQDAQTAEIADAITQAGYRNTTTVTQAAPAPPSGPVGINVVIDDEDHGVRDVQPLDLSTVDVPASWDDYVGQDAIKQTLMVYVAAAMKRRQRLPHMIFCGPAGTGKTTLSRMVGKTMGCQVIELVPPLNIETLVAAVSKLNDGDIVFIDEIHLLALRRRGSEILLKLLEAPVAYMPNGEVIPLPDVTYFGATTDKNVLPQTVIDRFIDDAQLGFEPYSEFELAMIAAKFVVKYGAGKYGTVDLMRTIARASLGTPRIVGKLAYNLDMLSSALDRTPTPEELLQFCRVEPDGLAQAHIYYLTALRQYCRRDIQGQIEYVGGERRMQTLLRETREGVWRLERPLLERGLIEATRLGRQLTPDGIARAEALIAAGKGARDGQ